MENGGSEIFGLGTAEEVRGYDGGEVQNVGQRACWCVLNNDLFRFGAFDLLDPERGV
ncbi:unnamed protein product, partial [Brassicogethes aeneus]